MFFKNFLLFLIAASVFIGTEASGFIDDFHTNTVSKYIKSGSGTLSYNHNDGRIHVTTGSNKNLTFSHSLSAATEGVFSIDFRSLKRYSANNSLEIRLIQDARTYYKITNREGSKYGGINKFVNGVRVDKAWFTKGYAQNRDYAIKIEFSAASTIVSAFGQTLIISNDNSPVTVRSFAIKTSQQNAYFDNIEYSVIKKGGSHTAKDNVATVEPVEKSSTGTSSYLEPINLPKCDASNPEVQFIKNKSDWSTINSSSKRIFCVSPGDYRSLGNIVITASGTPQKRRYIVLNNGNNTHPGKLSKSQLANYALDLRAASYWVIDRAASFDANHSHSFKINRGSTHNIFNRLFTQNVYHTMWIRNNANGNTIQNSRFDGVNTKGAIADLATINLIDNMAKSTTIKNTKVINNEFVNVKPFRIAKPPLTNALSNHTAPRQHVNAEGTIFDSNTVEYSKKIRTDCNGRLDPRGDCSQVETGLGVKAGSDNPDNPVIYSNNHIWGFRTVDPTIPNLSGMGVGIVVYMGAKHVKIRNNVLFDGAQGIMIADKYDAVYGTENIEVTGNLLYDLGKRDRAWAAAPITISQALNATIKNNLIISSTGRWANIWSNKNLYFGNNTIIDPDQTDVLLNKYTPKGMATNKIYSTAAKAGYVKSYMFIADKFTNSPRKLILNNAVKTK